MDNVHFKPESFTIRIYNDSKTYENRDDYTSMLYAKTIGDDILYFSGAKCILTYKIIKQIKTKAKELGFKQIQYVHKHKKIILDL